MTRSNLVKSAILAWIVTILLSIASGPLIKMSLSMEDYYDGLIVHKKLQNLNITTSSDYVGIKNTTKQFFDRFANFLECVLGLNIILTILVIFSQMFYEKILYAAAAVVFLIFTAAFVVFSVMSALPYKDLYNEHIDPHKTSDLHGQMTSSLKDNYWNDNFTTGTKMSNNWNHLFIDFECCGVNRVAGTTNDFDHTSWCTTNGSCQATASQIPKTCCKGFTEYDYQNAHSDCHSSVSPGFYYDKGCFSVIKKEVIKERIQFGSFYEDILREGLRVILVMGSCSCLSLLGTCVFIGICLKEMTSKPINGSTAQGHVEHVCPNSQTNNVSATQGNVNQACSTSQTNNASTTNGQVQQCCQTTQVDNASTGLERYQNVDPKSHANNASTAPGHAKNIISELNGNNNSDSTVTEHTDEKTRENTVL
ncbi:uncharacterized protein LOC128156433 [Crassostrea angulata]|uniref:uncharacterized protein LOC128156433 n=1 Tax=Magallana angulata TaxID=2784310 RepID=UPI0022B157D2|nr:uncharacterized protein LOC128156433 [Crassostrea angulata]